MQRVIDISGLPQTVVDAIEMIIRAYRARGASGPEGATARPIGWAKDFLPELPASFFEPLPDDVLDLFDGKAAA